MRDLEEVLRATVNGVVVGTFSVSDGILNEVLDFLEKVELRLAAFTLWSLVQTVRLDGSTLTRRDGLWALLLWSLVNVIITMQLFIREDLLITTFGKEACGSGLLVLVACVHWYVDHAVSFLLVERPRAIRVRLPNLCTLTLYRIQVARVLLNLTVLAYRVPEVPY